MDRCTWCLKDDDYIKYHDEEWGVPVHDDQRLFEMLILEGAQAGLSWLTILKRRQGYRECFDYFDIQKNANYSDDALEAKLLNPGIIRNRLKVFSVRTNAIAFLKVQEEFGSFDSYIWAFTKGKTIQNQIDDVKALPATSKISDVMSIDLKKRGFKFVGSTICYAYMQAIGMVDDHIVTCFKYKNR